MRAADQSVGLSLQGGALLPDKWAHVAFAIDGTGSATLMVDGDVVATALFAGDGVGTSLRRSCDAFRCGGREVGEYGYCFGSIRAWSTKIVFKSTEAWIRCFFFA